MKKRIEAKPERKTLKIIGFVFGLFAILTCGIPVFNIISIIVAMIGLVLSIIALKKSEKKGLAIAALILNILAICIGMIVLLITGGILLLLFSGYSGNLTYTNYSIGEKISSGNISLTVLSADKSGQIKNNQNQIIPIETTGYFLSIMIDLENRNLGAITIPGGAFAVMDSQGRIFSALSDAEGSYSNSISSDGAQVQPGVIFRGIKIFEVSKNSTDLKLRIKLSNTEGAYVSLD